MRNAVAAALNIYWLGNRYLRWEYLRKGETYAVLPHPSGVNRWWNEEENVARARDFLREAARAPGGLFHA